MYTCARKGDDSMMAMLGLSALSGVKSALTGGKKAVSKAAFGGGKRRRRRAKLTQHDLNTLMQIKNTLGKTAAAQALPYFMGRR